MSIAGRCSTEAGALGNLANLLAEQGQHEAAIERVERAVQIRRQEGDRRSLGVQLGNLGDFHAAVGRVRLARDYLEAALECAIEVEDRVMHGTWLGRLGALHTQTGRYTAAERYFEEGARLLQAPGVRWYLGYLRAAQVHLAVARADPEAGASWWAEARGLADTIQTKPGSVLGVALDRAAAALAKLPSQDPPA